MAISNHERVGKALDLVKDGLQPFVEREMKSQHAQLWIEEARGAVSESQSHLFKKTGEPQWDAASLLAVMWNQWQLVFRKTLGQAERTLVSEPRDVRNRWAHQTPFSSDDHIGRSTRRTGIPRSVKSRATVGTDEDGAAPPSLRRADANGEALIAGTAIESQATGTLNWREVVTPHRRCGGSISSGIRRHILASPYRRRQ
jgi:hypothetical protein